jgi:hypothetical protein
MALNAVLIVKLENEHLIATSFPERNAPKRREDLSQSTKLSAFSPEGEAR